MASKMTVTVDGETHSLDMERLTFAEARSFERVTGEMMSALGEPGAKSMTIIQALAWIIMKRDDTRLQFSDLDDRAIGDFEFDQEAEEGSSEPDPTEATDEP